MNNLMKFENELFGELRAISKEGQPWFVGKDVAESLGYKNSRDAIRNHVHEDDKGVEKLDTLGGNQEVTIINESGLYALIFGSRLKSAKQFKRWVTSEILPSIRQTGAYTARAELIGQEKMFRMLDMKVERLVGEAVREMEEKCSQFYRPASKEKTNITSYIKKRLGIDKANEEYELVKQRVLIKLGAEKWEDIPVETLVNSLDVVDESIKVIKSERVENQFNFFGAVDEVACSRY